MAMASNHTPGDQSTGMRLGRRLPMLALLPFAATILPQRKPDTWTPPTRGTIQVKDSQTGAIQGCLSITGRLIPTSSQCETWTAQTSLVDIPSVPGDEWIQAHGSQGWLVSEGSPFFPFSFKTTSELSELDHVALVLRNTTVGGRPARAIASQTQFYRVQEDTPTGKVLGGQYSNVEEPGLALTWNALYQEGGRTG